MPLFARCFAAIAVVAFLPTINAHAAFISVDTEQGPSTAVLDTSTGLEWLKISVTANRSVAQVESSFLPGGQLQGYRYATAPEFNCGLLTSYFDKTCAQIGSFQRPGDAASVEAFFNLFGFEGQGARFAYFGVDLPGTTATKEGFAGSFFYYNGPPPYYEYDSQKITLGPDFINRPAFHWLVTESDANPVPTPPTALLMAFGAIAFGSARVTRRGKHSKHAA